MRAVLSVLALVACGKSGDSSTATDAGTTTSAGATTDTDTDTTTSVPTSARFVVLVDTGADGTTAAAAASMGDLCPADFTWVGSYRGAAQCLSPRGGVVATLTEDAAGTAVGSDPAQTCPSGWDYRGTLNGAAVCSSFANGTVSTGTPCAEGSTKLGKGSSPQDTCFTPGIGAWYYTWYNPDGELWSDIDQADLCVGGFGPMGIGCYRAGPGTVLDLSHDLDGNGFTDASDAGALCPAGSTYVGVQGNMVWAVCAMQSTRAVAVIAENASGDLQNQVPHDQMCPSGFTAVGLDADGVVCVDAG